MTDESEELRRKQGELNRRQAELDAERARVQAEQWRIEKEIAAKHPPTPPWWTNRTTATWLVVLGLFLICVLLYGFYLREATKEPPTIVRGTTTYVSPTVPQWTPTFLQVKAGDVIEGTGEVKVFKTAISPDGVMLPQSDAYLYEWGLARRQVEPDFPYGALLGQVRGRTFFIGRQGVSPLEGELSVRFNGFQTAQREYDEKIAHERCSWPCTTSGRPITASLEYSGGYFFNVLPATARNAKVFNVLARLGWQRTSFVGGENIYAFGSANSKTSWTDGLFIPTPVTGWASPVPDFVSLSRRQVANCPFMGLVGKSENGSTFCMQQSMTLPGSGPIDMAVNDIYWDRYGNPREDWLTENEGGFVVRRRD